MSHEMPRWLDGPALRNWLLAQGVDLSSTNPSLHRAATRWKHGARADFYSDLLDRTLADYGLQSMIPDHLWAPTQKRSGFRPKTSHTRKKVPA